MVKLFHRLFLYSLFSFVIFFQEGHTKRSCKIRKSRIPRVASHDNTEFWNHVDLQKLRPDNSHDDVSDSDSDDDADDDDDDDDDDDGVEGADNDGDAGDDLFCHEDD